MEETKKLIPKRRFKEFQNAGEWEERALSDICEKFTDGDWIEAKDQSTTGIRLIQTGNIGITQYFDKSNNTKWISKDAFDRLNCKEIFPGDILISRLPEPAGRACIVPDIGQRMITAVDCTIVRVSPNIDSKYLVQYLATNTYFSEVNIGLAGGTRQRISRSNLAKFKIPLPKFSLEQEKIGKHFEELDNLIILQQRKLEKIKAMKKAYLYEMFPAQGESKPKRRFKGFTDDWEQRKLETIYNKIRNAFVGTATPYYVEEGNFYLESNNVKDGQINRKTEIFINDEFYLKQKDNWLQTGDIAMVQSGHVGHAAVIPKELNNTAAHALIIFSSPKIEVNPYFLNYQYQTMSYKKAIDKITTGNTIKHILSSDMKEFTVSWTNIGEQNKIADFFVELDNLITLHQSKLDKLKNLKKAYLNEMFI